MTEADDTFEIREIDGFTVSIEKEIGWICVEHDGSIQWDQLQSIKNQVWGDDARAIEVYPRNSDVINNGNYRHLWRLGDADFCPHMLGHIGGDTLAERSAAIWAKAGH